MYKKINKREARKLFENGVEIYLLPCKVRPGNAWIPYYRINYYEPFGGIRGFDYRVRWFEYYNCCAELGKYAAYYIEEEER